MASATEKPVWEPDFENVHATTPVYPQGVYEIAVDRVDGRAYKKTDGSLVRQVNLRPKMVGKFDSKNKLVPEMEGESVSDVRLFLHSEGGLRMAKGIMMAFAGYDKNEEDKFNAEVIKKGDFSAVPEEQDDGNFELRLGSGWDQFKGCHAKVTLLPTTYQPKDSDGNPTGDPQEQQDFKGWTPVKSKK